MKEFFAWLFSEKNSNLKITLFDGWHFFYLILIFGISILLTFLLNRKSQTAKENTCKIFAYLTIILYVADFFIMPLSDSYNGISEYKLPFNICTLMAIMAPFAQFNKKFDKIKPTIVVLSIASSLMWMCYPGTALNGQPPFSYIIFQTFMYHGFLFAWGFLNLSLGQVNLSIKKVWKEFVGIIIILVWACFGNAIYGDWNWFFIQKSIFPFLSDEIMPVLVVITVFAVCLVIYGIYYLTKHLSNKTLKNKQTNVNNTNHSQNADSNINKQ